MLQIVQVVTVFLASVAVSLALAHALELPGKMLPRLVTSVDEQWERLRNQWEYSHVMRAVLSAAGLICLLVGIVVRQNG